jgi:hypothetical protein
VPTPYAVLRLIEFASDEIESFRKRQISMFRDAIIVMVVVTSGASIAAAGKGVTEYVQRGASSAAAATCLIVGLVSALMVRRYRDRIHLIRERREDLVRRIRPKFKAEDQAVKSAKSEAKAKKAIDAQETWLFYPKGVKTTSTPYARAMYGLTVIAVLINLLAAALPPERSDGQGDGEDKPPVIASIEGPETPRAMSQDPASAGISAGTRRHTEWESGGSMMEPQVTSLLEAWELTVNWAVYLLLVVIADLLVRILSVAMKASEEQEPGLKNFARDAWGYFKGGGPVDVNRDYWHPFILGIFELAGYPILMVTGNWSFIAAWIALKTLAQWQTWKEYRTAFNRFLIGNAMVLVLAFLWLSNYVKVTG